MGGFLPPEELCCEGVQAPTLSGNHPPDQEPCDKVSLHEEDFPALWAFAGVDFTPDTGTSTDSGL